MSIEFKASVELKHINVRKEGPDDDKVTALDLKLCATTTAQLIDDLLCVDEEKGRALSAFWEGDGAPRMLSLGDVKMSRQILNAKASLGGMTFGDCTAKNFSFAVKDQHAATLTFSISSTDFPSSAIAVLAEKLQESIELHFWTPQGDLFTAGAEAAPVAAPVAQEEVDPLYEDAVRHVRETQRASISFVQRRLAIGYNRAARLVEAMELAGVVSHADAAGARQVLLPADEQEAA